MKVELVETSKKDKWDDKFPAMFIYKKGTDLEEIVVFVEIDKGICVSCGKRSERTKELWVSRGFANCTDKVTWTYVSQEDALVLRNT